MAGYEKDSPGALPQPGDFKVYNPYYQAPQPGLAAPTYAPPSLGQTDYLFGQSETKIRGTTDRMFYSAGFSYLAGQGAGLIYGAAEGMKMSKNEGYSSKVRTTVVTSQMAKRGMFLGNTFGVLGLTFGAINGALVNARDNADDSLNTIAAGIATGAAARASAGALGAMRGATVGGIFAVGATALYNVGQGREVFEGITGPISSLLA